MWMVIGHERVVEGLSQAAAVGELPHALLMAGPPGIGKRTLAQELAKALNCTGTDPPCQTCMHCRQIASGSHPDVTVVSNVEGKENIAIEQVRALRESASLLPYQGSQKVYIIDEAERLTAQAADALLKTLEEPQPQVTLILTVSDIGVLPATVVSRCRMVALRAVDDRSVVSALESRGVDEFTASRVARLARGRVGWALEALRQPKLIEQQEALAGRLANVFDLTVEERLALAETMAGDRKDRVALRRHMEMLVVLGRDLLLLTQEREPMVMTGEQRRNAMAQVARLGSAGVVAYLRRIRLTMQRIDANVDPRLALEALLLNLE